ncbi:family 20 glycosylhydrolase [Microbacterium esteraromaticum]|uniref:beta-N-acetylhexosaminidase n=1 Tax=Microbacterium esteraromaticum TaxID=57043 RepID=A0A7D7WED5_9MICO|nr:family 20 glycosylhydrolase [Microbacterium esteraromaticum]QMU97517.1 family 20 glycosylhydrolase [Microbacterium esteraromaticum]
MVFPVASGLVPAPTSVDFGDDVLMIGTGTTVSGPPAAVERLQDAVARRTGIRPGWADDASDATVVLRVDDTIPDAEGYRLIVGESVDIAGADSAGLQHGVETLIQLVSATGEGWGWPAVRIEDAPRFAHRGLMLDVARHFFPVDEVKTVIDRAAALKLNRLHLHLSDDQGWRIQIDAWPLLTERASGFAADPGDQGGFYTKEDFREIVAHAASRHIIVIPEIDLPGHTHAVGVAYPDLVDEPHLHPALLADAERLGHALPVKGEPYTGWGVGHSSLRIRDERTWDFVRDVLAEIAEMSPGPWIHIGGDESLGTSADDFAYAIERATSIVRELGRIPVAWHEAGAAPALAEGTVGQYWGSLAPEQTHAAHATHFVARGGKIVLSPSDAAYLDMKYDADFPLGLAWAGTVSVERAYGWDPAALLDLPDEAIAGIEAPLWSETVRSLPDAELLMYPRIAAVAELAWSQPGETARDWGDFRERVGRLSPLWQSERIRFHPVDEIPWSAR